MNAANEIVAELRRALKQRDELQDSIDAITTALGIEDAQHAIDAIETLKKERDEAREELAGLRAEVDQLTESLRACVAERDGWQRTARARSDEIETLEEKLHADTVTRIAVTRAWREAVAEVAEVLARTAAKKEGRP